MADRLCYYCDDKGDCYRCSYFFQPDAVHKACGFKWKKHEVKTQEHYPPWAVCPSSTKKQS